MGFELWIFWPTASEIADLCCKKEKKWKSLYKKKKFENYFRNKVAEISVILFSFFSASIEKLFVTLFFLQKFF